MQTSIVKCSINDKILYHIGFDVTVSWKYKLNQSLSDTSSIAMWASSRIRRSEPIDCVSVKECPTSIQWRACWIMFWSASYAVLEIRKTVSFTVGVGRKKIAELLWVAHNKRCVLPTSLPMNTI